MWIGTRGADDKVNTRPNHGAFRREFWERSISFLHSDDMTVGTGVHDCGAVREVTENNSFSVVLSAAPMVATITVTVMFLSVPLGGILTMMVLLSPAVPPTIHPH